MANIPYFFQSMPIVVFGLKWKLKLGGWLRNEDAVPVAHNF